MSSPGDTSPGHAPGATTKTESGHAAEEAAATFLKRQGYHIRHTNWRCQRGEIDLVVEKTGEIAFVEVKLRSSGGHGRPGEAVNRNKERRIIAAASLYAAINHLEDAPMRFDILEVFANESGEMRFRHWPGAFIPTGGYSPM